MKTLGLIGGMSWESTAEYYRLINQGINQKLGGLHSAKLILHSVDFDEIEKLQHAGKWDEMGIILTNIAHKIESSSADGIMICTNTMHKLAKIISNNINIPLLHIADATGKLLVSNDIHKVGLLGTAFTMEEIFYRDRLMEKFDLEIITPKKGQRDDIHNIIYDELCLGITKDSSRKRYSDIIDSLKKRGAEAVILGCTEIGLLIEQKDSSIPIYDTARIHAEYAVEWMIG
jgi:aspartate racemase